MKFKIAVTGLLAAILATCIFTSYKLTTEAEKQTKIAIIDSPDTTGSTWNVLEDLHELVGSDAVIHGDSIEEYMARQNKN